MSLDRDGLSEIDVRPIGADEQSQLAAAVGLGDLCRKTVGLLPPEAYAAAAKDGTLLGVFDHAGQVLAYALYGLPRQHVRLTHLCVKPGYRKLGIAKRLVDEISYKYPDRTGIRAKCRRDYGLDEMWTALGFRVRSEVAGRGKERAPLTVWWKDHGHPDLFTSMSESAILQVSIDLNILRDLTTDASRPSAKESQVLTADYLAGVVELVRTPALDREIARIDARLVRTRLINAVEQFAPVTGSRLAVEDARARLISAVADANPGYPRSVQDESDLMHVVETSAAGVPVLVTRDLGLREILGDAALRELNIRVLPPSDVVVRIDELTREEAYRPAQLLGTDYQHALLGSGADRECFTLLDRTNGERRSEFQALLRASAGRGSARWCVRNPQGNLEALYASRNTGAELQVPLFRVAETPLTDTLTRQLIFMLRQSARATGLSAITISDSSLSASTLRAALDDGFRRTEAGWTALTLDICGDAEEIEARAELVSRRVKLTSVPRLRPNLAPLPAAEAERVLWPAKIVNSQLQSYLVPIYPTWSAELFGVPLSYMARSAQLGISREHVYYRSPRPAIFGMPGRILWYVGGGSDRQGPGAVIAASLLEEVLIDRPGDLYDRFKHLGVWNRSNINAVSKGGMAQALRFSNTEIFPKPVSLRRLREVAARNCHTLLLRSANKIGSDLFASVYREGWTRE